MEYRGLRLLLYAVALALVVGVYTASSSNSPTVSSSPPTNKQYHPLSEIWINPSYPVDWKGLIFKNIKSIEAGKFVDKDDTSYYIDPAGTSEMKNVNVKGTLNMHGNDIRNVNEIQMPKVTIKGDGSVSTGLNADKLDGYDASDLLAAIGSSSTEFTSIEFTYTVPPNVKFQKRCANVDGQKVCKVKASLCTVLCGENGYSPPDCIPGKKSDGSYYTCNDVNYGIFLNDTSGLVDSDGDGLKESVLKMEVDDSVNPFTYGIIIYSQANEMVEHPNFLQTDFSVSQEVNKWKCYTWDYCGCNCIGKSRKKGAMRIWNTRTGDRKWADVKICFDLGKEVSIKKVVFDYEMIDYVRLYVGTENSIVYVDHINLGGTGWVRDKEVTINKRGRYFCFWLKDYWDDIDYIVYIDNVRLWIEP